MNDDPLLTMAEAASLTALSEAELHRCRLRGELRLSRADGRNFFARTSEVHRFIKARAERAAVIEEIAAAWQEAEAEREHLAAGIDAELTMDDDE